MNRTILLLLLSALYCVTLPTPVVTFKAPKQLHLQQQQQLATSAVNSIAADSGHDQTTSVISQHLQHQHQQHNHISNHNHQDNPLANKKLVKLGNKASSSARNLYNSLATRTHNQSSDLTADGRSGDSSQLQSNSQQQQQQQLKKGLFEKICIGTSNRLSAQQNKTDHYHNLVERYINCTYVIGNLEITWLEKELDNEPIDLTFLESIREITGYLLIAYVHVEKIRMPNLQIIRGRDLLKFMNGKEEFGMLLHSNDLKTLELPHLSEILAGSIGSYENRNLCHIKQIDWSEILNPPYRSIFEYNGTEVECPACDSACGSSPCWGPGADMCQRFSKNTCSQQCGQGRCFGPLPQECCHLFCSGGCTGPKQTDCFSCKNFYDDGECIQECPSMQRYNSNNFIWETNPNGKYAFGATCVKECPEHILRDNGACVRTCPPNKRSLNGECVPCIGPCPKNCQGVEVVHSGNIDQLINCTVIEGSITILDHSFTGFGDIYANDTTMRHEAMHPSRLEVFKTVHQITGYLNIQANHPDFKDLSCFRNLQAIGGRQTTDLFYSLSIIKTSLVELNLRSLRKVRSGKVVIEENKDLCFADTIDWLQANITRREDITIRNNAEAVKCRQLNLQCHEQCAKDGCWGPRPDECLSCNNYKLDNHCVDNCTSTQSEGILSYDDGNHICRKCDAECKGGCNGPEAKHCWQCKNVKDGPYCVAECPSHKFNRDGICEECDKSCLDACTGASNRLGEGGCNACGKAIIPFNSPEPTYCIRADEPCPEGYYQEYVSPQVEGPLRSSSGRPICRKCHHKCKSCTGFGTHISVCDCDKYQAGEQCEDYCPRDHFPNNQTRQCVKCSPECNDCFGPTEAHCVTCKVYRIYYDSTEMSSALAASMQLISPGGAVDFSAGNDPMKPAQQRPFKCTSQCPPEKPHRISESDMLTPFCSEVSVLGPENPRPGSLSYTMFALVALAVIVCFIYSRRQIENDKRAKLAMHLSGIDDVEPLNPSNLRPNLAPLRSIKETELRQGKILGSGFGGTVYQGLWFPEGQHKEHRCVAIKVLRDNGQSNMNKEFLDEAYIMASVNHPNLVRLLAVCMTPRHLMLVTQLMPLGCLLEYVKKHKNDIGAKNLLEWCKQIARGMAYLEEHRMVHRDLALRNILLLTPGRALISDFGLAKFLELDQSEYQSGGGRLPIKWLAPECIRERKFTHKSDVWAFGVTVWELLTFGRRPFEEYDLKDVPVAIENGARLRQPGNMSTEVYKVMFACWFYNPEDRPNFRGLVQSFVNFARDPERYLICGSKGIEFSARMVNSESDCAGLNEYEEYEYETNSMIDDADNSTQPPMSANSMQPELTPSTHNRINEVFGFQTQHQHHLHHHLSESDAAATAGNQPVQPSHLLTPTLKKMGILHSSGQHLMEEDVFSMTTNSTMGTPKVNDAMHLQQQHHHHHQRFHLNPRKASLTDANNNNLVAGNSRLNVHNSNSCWSVRQSVSTNSLGQKLEPMDAYDYLLPSPTCPNDHGQFGALYPNSYEPNRSAPMRPLTTIGGALPVNNHQLRNPPHSAGLMGVSNEQYFINFQPVAANYANQKNMIDDDDGSEEVYVYSRQAEA